MRGVGEQRVARRRADPLPRAVGEAKAEHVPRRGRHADERAGNRRERVADDHERLPGRQAVGPPTPRPPWERRRGAPRARGTMTRPAARREGNAAPYAARHPSANASAASRVTIAHTAPPNPAPNADAAIAPRSRALRARKIVSGTWFPSTRSASDCERSANSPILA